MGAISGVKKIRFRALEFEKISQICGEKNQHSTTVMKKLLFLCMLLMGAATAFAQNSNQGFIGRAIGEAQQHGCFDGLAGYLHGTATGSVDNVRVACGPSTTGIGTRVYLYAPVPCPPNAEICIQVIVPIAEVIFGCGNDVISVTCLSNQPVEL